MGLSTFIASYKLSIDKKIRTDYYESDNGIAWGKVPNGTIGNPEIRSGPATVMGSPHQHATEYSFREGGERR